MQIWHATFSTIATRWEISFSAGFDATKLRVELMQLSVCYCEGYPPIAHHYQPYKLLPFFTHVDTCRRPFFSSGRRSVCRRAVPLVYVASPVRLMVEAFFPPDQ